MVVTGVVERSGGSGVASVGTGGGRVLRGAMLATVLLLLLLLLLLSLPRSVARVVGSIGLTCSATTLIVIVIAGAGHTAGVLVAGIAGRGGLTSIALVAGGSGLTSSETLIDGVPGGGGGRG